MLFTNQVAIYRSSSIRTSRRRNHPVQTSRSQTLAKLFESIFSSPSSIAGSIYAPGKITSFLPLSGSLLQKTFCQQSSRTSRLASLFPMRTILAIHVKSTAMKSRRTKFRNVRSTFSRSELLPCPDRQIEHLRTVEDLPRRYDGIIAVLFVSP